MNEYCKVLSWQINASKSKVLAFSRGKIRNKPIVTFNEHVLEVVDHFVYQGKNFIRMVTLMLQSSIFMILQVEQCLVSLKKGRSMNVDKDIQLKLFDSVVVPIMLYGCEVWRFSNVNLIENLHLKFCTLLLKVINYTSSNMIYGELGRKPLSNLIKSRMIRYWFEESLG